MLVLTVKDDTLVRIDAGDQTIRLHVKTARGVKIAVEAGPSVVVSRFRVGNATERGTLEALETETGELIASRKAAKAPAGENT